MWAAVLALGAGLACGPGEPENAGTTIGVSLLTRAHVFYRDLEDGLRAGAAEQGYQLLVNAAEWDAGRQISQLEDFTTRGVDAIIVCPVDSNGIGAGIRTANRARIPVFTADIASTAGEVVSHIASDNLAGGRLAGEYLAGRLGGRGRVAIINQPAITSVLDRVQGFREALARHPGIEIVADVDGLGLRDRALQAAADVLQANPQLDGVFGINDDSALGALDAVEDFGREGIVIVGYDATPPARDAILKGRALKADVVQYPFEIGRRTIDTIARHLAGEEVPAVVPVEVGIVDRDRLLEASPEREPATRAAAGAEPGDGAPGPPAP
ncbi:MAG TPA: substrate-binding domain-containing protein [Thermoanaerobaculales bacterium]|nr:substrate-binding domain-containing protein [Thermoanaerobaculales bacterium]HPA81072.1 substrate-binding domain-containing protein [Thermoanaerobaculales bacterium]HQL30664.1 substrate-binding domain-containing protein [Thermoanaerobaculales bacterium]HQN95682.1 substrate-binding domain-containing protein [Thermoanaerobaculales bacterium]HQP43396.1 substrate-binding domain-containing protein [Thermoanaerobaculales bacterium]